MGISNCFNPYMQLIWIQREPMIWSLCIMAKSEMFLKNFGSERYCHNCRLVALRVIRKTNN